MFRALICPSSGARDYTCVIAAYGRIACCSTPNSRLPTTKALHTICGNNTSVVSSFWWRAYKCPKHVEQIIIAIKHSVASSRFSSLRLYYDARTNIHQTHLAVFIPNLCFVCIVKYCMYCTWVLKFIVCFLRHILAGIRVCIYLFGVWAYVWAYALVAALLPEFA